MALYRTYRPATFAEVVGQEHVTEPLSRALDSGRINHAYLFSGPRGCGKTSSARILARSLNCEHGPTSTPCGTCSSCVALAPGGPGNLDVVELDAASHGGVDDTRDLRDRAFFAPADSRYRVFIIDEAHMVTSAGFNALLKIVEEPPEHLIFIFATTEPEKVLTTIKSRTHHYPFRLLAPPVMRGLLEDICAKEDVVVAPDVYPLVIRAGGGSPRDSLSILDQLLAGAGDEGVTYPRALALLGVTDSALIDEAVDALAAGDGAALFGVVERVVDAGHDPRRFAIDLLDRFRDLILVQAVPDAAARGLVEAPEDQVAAMVAVAADVGPATLTRYAEVAHTALGEMRGTTSPRLLLEVMCARLLLPSAAADDAALLQRIETLERRPAGTAASAGPGGVAPATPASGGPQAPVDEETPRFVRPSQVKAAEEARAEQERAEKERAAQQEREQQEQAERAQQEREQQERAQQEQAAQERAQQEQAERERAEQERAEQERAEQERVERERAVQAAAAAPEPTPESEPASAPPRVVHPPTVSDPRAPEPPRRADQPPRSYDDEIPPAEPPADFDYPPPPEDGHRSRPAAHAPAEPEPEPEETPAAPGLTVEAVSARWPDIRAAVRSQSTVLEAMLSAAFVHQVEGTRVVLGHPHPALVGRLADERGLRALTSAIVDVFGAGHTVDVVNAQPGAAPTSGAAPAQDAAPRKQTFTRPSRPRDTRDVGGSDSYVPEPEEPAEPVPDEELTDAERDEMVAQSRTGAPEDRIDPDEIALELLTTELGARPLE